MEYGIEVRLLKELAYMGHDFAGVGVAPSQFLMLWEGPNLENRNYDGVSVEINGERVKGRVSDRGRDIVFDVVKRYITEPVGEVGSRRNPGTARSGARDESEVSGVAEDKEDGSVEKAEGSRPLEAVNRLRRGFIWPPAVGEQR